METTGMSCAQMSARLDAVLAGDRALAILSAPDMQSHLARCRSCTHMWRQVRALAERIDQLAIEDPDDDRALAAAVARARDGLRHACGRIGRPLARYDWMEAPVGRIFVATSERGVYDVAFQVADEAAYRRRLGRRASELYRDRTAVQPVLDQLDDYFSGRRRQFSLEMDLRGLSGFTSRVLAATRQIPFGRLQGYGEMARRIGAPGASRAVGQALGRNPVPIVVPCHRVVATAGRLGGFTGGLDTKRVLLEHEGHRTSERRVMDHRAGVAPGG